jgi:integrase
MPGPNGLGTLKPSSSFHEFSNEIGGESPSKSWRWGTMPPPLSQTTGTKLIFHVSFYTYLVMFALFLHIDGWTSLPDPRGESGTRSRQSTCVGCRKGLRRDIPQHLCRFATTGFRMDGAQYLPCGTVYHIGCIMVGEPFRSRLPHGRGLIYPRTRIAPPFICEACTVRAQIGSELQKTSRHVSLLMLERMRMVDQANAWSPGTHQNYQALLAKLTQFERAYGLTLLQPTPLCHPPRHASIGVMWAQQQYLLCTPTGSHSQSEDRIRFGTARALRSAASQYYLWDRQIAHPERTLRDSRTRKVYLADGVSPTDAMGYALMATGMAKRVGDHNKPPIALTFSQIQWIMDHLASNWRLSVSPAAKRETAAAAVTNLLGWLGWLRSAETFSLTWGDVSITRPVDGPRRGLPPGVGVIELRLLPETKSNRTKVADVVISYLCASGLSLGIWMDRLLQVWPQPQSTDLLIKGDDGHGWTSHFFRVHHLYPWLRRMRADGDPFLQAFTTERGNRIEDKYYSFGTYRRGGRSSSTKRNSGLQPATPDEVYEHGRWTRRISTENMPTRYNEYSLADRVNITLLCM